MSLFGGGEEIAVDSVVYNLAGDEIDRPNYLKGIVARNILSGTKDSMADTIQNAYIKSGPRLKFSLFYNWARKSSNYGTVGMPTGEITSASTLNPDQVEAEIPVGTGKTAYCQVATVGTADFMFWAERWVLDEYPNQNKTWTADFNSSTKVISITVDGTTTTITAGSPTFNNTAKYVYAYYNEVSSGGTYGPTKLYIYRVGSGNPDLDRLVNKTADYGEFFPFIPVRIDNVFVSETFLPTVYEQAKKAYKKATDGSFDELVEKITDNESLADIDYAYIVYGVSLNAIDNSARKYMYEFFTSLLASQIGGPNIYNEWKGQVASQQDELEAWKNWRLAQDSSPEPTKPNIPTLPSNEIRITSTGTVLTNYDIRIGWNFIGSGAGSGLGKSGAKRGDLWFQTFASENYKIGYNIYETNSGDGGTQTQADPVYATFEKVRLYWQRTNNSYTYLDLYGLVHTNMIYGGKSVRIGSIKALTDTEESGFIIPLHNTTFRNMSIVDATQMGTACVFVVFNCYVVKKLKWYESGIFRIFLVIIISIIAAVFTGGSALGILGSAISVGTSMGFSGLTAIIVGAVANAVAGIIVSTLLEQVMGALGPLGQIIGAVLMMVAGSFSQGIASGLANFDWSSLLRVDNLLNLTNAVGGAYAQSINMSTMEIMEDMTNYAEQAKNEAEKIQQAFFKQFGYGGGQIDPLMSVDTPKIMAESPSTFLNRTLLTGSEIAALSHDLLYNFSEYSIKLPDAFT